jgi:hypothetical protein
VFEDFRAAAQGFTPFEGGAAAMARAIFDGIANMASAPTVATAK